MATVLVYVGHFYAAVANGVGVFITVLACFSIPWIVMVVIGHRRRSGYYDVDALQVFNRGERGGIYWFWHGFNVPAMLVWAVASAAGLMFGSNSWYVGPGADALGGVDLGFLVAGLLAAVMYPIVLRLYPEPLEVFGERKEPRNDLPEPDEVGQLV